MLISKLKYHLTLIILCSLGLALGQESKEKEFEEKEEIEIEWIQRKSIHEIENLFPSYNNRAKSYLSFNEITTASFKQKPNLYKAKTYLLHCQFIHYQ